MRNIFLYPVEALNLVRTNIWAVALIIAGVVLTLHGHSDVGGSLATGGFALLRSEATSNPTPVQEPSKKEQ